MQNSVSLKFKILSTLTVAIGAGITGWSLTKTLRPSDLQAALQGERPALEAVLANGVIGTTSLLGGTVLTALALGSLHGLTHPPELYKPEATVQPFDLGITDLEWAQLAGTSQEASDFFLCLRRRGIRPDLALSWALSVATGEASQD
ncbi:hypothetical protein [Leptolyngbya sp. FACHB-261]|uniref:hypothetical protein n=1 Tax=Leptolyngbya sp. FACHB-261 TaxID=2692806 RepID=UPI001683B293|nr:hypothetical protein [Leptolyngbya sp. FACHB-261]MBD2102638.1 hypothetical protein [Leptolyngbya sp. FACHB-261]